MTSSVIHRPTEKILSVERSLLASITEFLKARHPDIAGEHLYFLCEPWAHFFTHSAMHRVELCPQTIAFEYSAEIDPQSGQKIPGDTLAFFEFFRTSDYPAYLDARLAGKPQTIECRDDVQCFAHSQSKQIHTECFKPCFPRSFRYALQFFSLGRIRFTPEKATYRSVATDWNERQQLKEHVAQSLTPDLGHTALWMAVCVAELFPKSLLENLGESHRQKNNLPARRNLFSADAWHIIDEWKIYAVAQKTKNQAVWMGSPNALGHGSLAVFWQREFEIKNLDRYLTWGWSVSSNPHVQPFYSPHYAGQNWSIPSASGSGILISSAARPQHLLEYPYTPNRFESYLMQQLKLATQLHRCSHMSVAIRSRPRDLGWDVAAMVRSLNEPEITIEFQSGKFVDRLKQSALHICDNCSTTIVESFWANHPTMILLENNRYFDVKEEAQEEYDVLSQCGIYHDNMESLVRQFEKIKDNVTQWWTAPSTQRAVAFYLERQGRCGSTLKDWKKVLSC